MIVIRLLVLVLDNSEIKTYFCCVLLDFVSSIAIFNHQNKYVYFAFQNFRGDSLQVAYSIRLILHDHVVYNSVYFLDEKGNDKPIISPPLLIQANQWPHILFSWCIYLYTKATSKFDDLVYRCYSKLLSVMKGSFLMLFVLVLSMSIYGSHGNQWTKLYGSMLQVYANVKYVWVLMLTMVFSVV